MGKGSGVRVYGSKERNPKAQHLTPTHPQTIARGFSQKRVTEILAWSSR